MIFHIDMDAFFTAVEQRERPRYKNRPVVVAGDSERSVVAAASYEARAYGIRSAMPLFLAKQKCEHLAVLPADRRKYADESEKIMETIRSYSPLFEQVSVDEAYIDISGCTRIFGDPRTMALSIKNEIKKRHHLTCSVGGAPFKFMAKIASDMKKPDGLFIVEKDKAQQFADTVSIGRIPGVGEKALSKMSALGIDKLGDVKRFQKSILEKKFGAFGTTLLQYASCVDTSKVGRDEKKKSISSESTLHMDTGDFDTIKKNLLLHSARVAKALRKHELFFRNVFIKIKFSDFSQITRQKKVSSVGFSSRSIFNDALSLARKVDFSKTVRLVGVGVTRLMPKGTPYEIEMLTNSKNSREKKWEQVDTALDAISEKFGNHIVKNASLKR